MADVQTAQSNLLQSKWGPLPVWGWALIALGLAWAYAKYRASKSDQAAAGDTTASTGTAADETQAVAPQFVIENNLPATPAGPTTPPPSSPVTTPTTPPVTTTPPGTGSHPPVVSKPAPKPVSTTKTPAKKPPIQYKVVAGDSLSSIAAKYKVKGGWQELWTYNTTAGNRPAATIATLKKRGPNSLVRGETILIPQ